MPEYTKTETHVVINSAGVQGPKGYSGVEHGPIPPTDTSVLWADTSDDFAIELIPGPEGPVGPQGPKGDKGDTGNTSIHELRGTGFPEGVVTASPGTYYTDTAITNGAVRWVKVSGTGSTGWQVVHGEVTRDVKDLTTNGHTTTNALRLQRTGNTVAIYFYQLVYDGSASGNIAALPLDFGFRPTGLVYFKAHDGGAGYISGGGITFIYPTAIAHGHRGHIVWTTTDPWPSTLPGVAG